MGCWVSYENKTESCKDDIIIYAVLTGLKYADYTIPQHCMLGWDLSSLQDFYFNSIIEP